MVSYEKCTLCPRKCGVNRATGQRGFCGMSHRLRAAKAMLHYGEEPAIAGNFGTGAVFFSGCTLRCRYCQNGVISDGGVGAEVTTARLREIFETLIDEGAESIDLVTPTHFLPSILPALTPKLPVPLVYNCGGYESVETLRELDGLVDVYLPDLKYSDNALAAQWSAAPDYFEVATEAIREMYRQTGPAVLEDERLVHGVLIRHLVLPGHLDNSLGVIDWVGEQFPSGAVLFSLMSQYVPMNGCPAPFDRRITREEYDGAVSWMELCGIRRGYTQDYAAATTEYLPEFDLSGL